MVSSRQILTVREGHYSQIDKIWVGHYIEVKLGQQLGLNLSFGSILVQVKGINVRISAGR